MKKVWFIIGSVVLLLAVGGGAFYAGVKYGQSHLPYGGRQFPPEGFEMRQGQGQGMLGDTTEDRANAGFSGGGLVGTIQSIDGNVLVINTGDDTVKVETTDSTLIQKTMTVAVGDLEIEERVMVMGRENDDGTITARSIMPMTFPQVTQGTEGQ